jgi:hypothetical protein
MCLTKKGITKNQQEGAKSERVEHEFERKYFPFFRFFLLYGFFFLYLFSLFLLEKNKILGENV